MSIYVTITIWALAGVLGYIFFMVWIGSRTKLSSKLLKDPQIREEVESLKEQMRTLRKEQTKTSKSEDDVSVMAEGKIMSISRECVTKEALVEKVAAEVGLGRKNVANIVDAFTKTIADAVLRGEKVTLVGFGSFELAEKKKKRAVNPVTGETIQIPAKEVKFDAGKALREAVEKK